MAMTNNGLSKLVEEIGELGQVAGKMLQYPALMHDVQVMANVSGEGGFAKHPDGTNLRLRLQEELADVMAAARFVMVKLDLDVTAVFQRQCAKESLFNQWDKNEP